MTQQAVEIDPNAIIQIYRENLEQANHQNLLLQLHIKEQATTIDLLEREKSTLQAQLAEQRDMPESSGDIHAT